MFGICNLSICALRQEADNHSNMTNQVLFGETFEIIEKDKNWSKIKLSYDGFEGFIQNNQYLEISKIIFDEYQTEIYSNELVSVAHNENDRLYILAGAHLPKYHIATFEIDNKSYSYKGEIALSSNPKTELVEIATSFLNTPFLNGGKSVFGIDASNFVQMVYKLWGYRLPREVDKQSKHGETLSFIMESEAGDLAFFDDEQGNICHVGIVMDNDCIIHSYGRVRIDKLDQTGIYNIDNQKHTHKLRMIKRIVN